MRRKFLENKHQLDKKSSRFWGIGLVEKGYAEFNNLFFKYSFMLFHILQRIPEFWEQLNKEKIKIITCLDSFVWYSWRTHISSGAVQSMSGSVLNPCSPYSRRQLVMVGRTCWQRKRGRSCLDH